MFNIQHYIAMKKALAFEENIKCFFSRNFGELGTIDNLMDRTNYTDVVRVSNF